MAPIINFFLTTVSANLSFWLSRCLPWLRDSNPGSGASGGNCQQGPVIVHCNRTTAGRGDHISGILERFAPLVCRRPSLVTDGEHIALPCGGGFTIGRAIVTSSRPEFTYEIPQHYAVQRTDPKRATAPEVISQSGCRALHSTCPTMVLFPHKGQAITVPGWIAGLMGNYEPIPETVAMLS